MDSGSQTVLDRELASQMVLALLADNFIKEQLRMHHFPITFACCHRKATPRVPLLPLPLSERLGTLSLFLATKYLNLNLMPKANEEASYHINSEKWSAVITLDRNFKRQEYNRKGNY